jgi:hypothetical protein
MAWYRSLSAEQQIASEPTDMLFIEDNRPIRAQVVRFSFDFARAMVAFEANASVPADRNDGRTPAASGPEFQHLVETEAKSESEAQQAGNDVKSLAQRRLTVSEADRNNLEVEIADTQSRLELLQAISAGFRNLLDFIRATDASRTQTTDLGALVDGLERTLPEASSGASSHPPIVVYRYPRTNLGRENPCAKGAHSRWGDRTD